MDTEPTQPTLVSDRDRSRWRAVYSLHRVITENDKLLAAIGVFIALTVFGQERFTDPYSEIISFSSLLIALIVYLEFRCAFPYPLSISLSPKQLRARIVFIQLFPENRLAQFSLVVDVLFATVVMWILVWYSFLGFLAVVMVFSAIWTTFVVRGLAFLVMMLLGGEDRAAALQMRLTPKLATKVPWYSQKLVIGPGTMGPLISNLLVIGWVTTTYPDFMPVGGGRFNMTVVVMGLTTLTCSMIATSGLGFSDWRDRRVKAIHRDCQTFDESPDEPTL